MIVKQILLALSAILLLTAIALSAIELNKQTQLQSKWTIALHALLWLTLINSVVIATVKHKKAVGGTTIVLAIVLIAVGAFHLAYRQGGWFAPATAITAGLLLIAHASLHVQPPPNKARCSDDTIFVSVASYRDKRCSETVRSLFENAAAPQNITVGICQQNDWTQDADCVPPEWESQVRIIRMNHFDARGPTFARYLCATLWGGERYFLQIDSHILFAKDWDVKLINMIKALKASGVKKPVLSHYTKLHTDYYQSSGGDNTVPVICRSFFNDDGMISFEGANNITTDKTKLPKPSAYIAGGMMFAESDFLKDVPFDPNLPNLFVGEEILHSIRFWTNGWDIFTPTENVIFHYYTREGEPKVWTDNKHFDSRDATVKVKNILKLDTKDIAPHLAQNLEVYGIGKERSLDDYFAFAGIDIANKKVTKDFCQM